MDVSAKTQSLDDLSRYKSTQRRSDNMMKNLRRSLQEERWETNSAKLEKNLSSTYNSNSNSLAQGGEFYRLNRSNIRRTLDAMDGSRKTVRSRSLLDASTTSMSQSSLSVVSYSSLGKQKKKKQKKRSLQETSSRKSKMNLSTSIRTIEDTKEEVDDSNFFDRFQRKGKFYKRTKFIIVMSRVYHEQSQRVKDVLSHFDAMDDSLEDIDLFQTAFPSMDLMFDVTDYKPSLKGRISNEVKRVLSIPPGQRTEKELHAVRVGLINYPTICQYPVQMQQKIAERGWYEGHAARNVILREGHSVLYFYVILSGSAVVVVLTPDRTKVRRVCTLRRGDMFGELAIVNRTRRQSSVISREHLELLVLDESDYNDIFLTGGLNDISDPFLKKSKYLDGWPLECLRNNTKKAMYSYFKRGTVVVQSNKFSDWLYFIKSGSCKVLLKLKNFDPRRKREDETARKKRQEKEDLEDLICHLPHSEQLTVRLEEENLKLEAQSFTYQLLLPDINVPTKPSYRKNNFRRSTVKEADGENNVTPRRKTNASSRRSSIASIVMKLPSRMPTMSSQAPFLAKTPSAASSGKRTPAVPNLSRRLSKRRPSEYESFVTILEDGKIDGHRTITTDLNREYFSSLARQNRDKNDPDDVTFVCVMQLSEGDVFGIADDLYESQPEVSLISNGAECLLISKKLYWNNIPPLVYTTLKDKIAPYPSLEQYTDKLYAAEDWKAHTKENLRSMLQAIKARKTDVHDARSSLPVEREFGNLRKSVNQPDG
ncbi:uncharacterized protein LOC135490891 [Lineus longissimus]|uniref:uncharacterized protein LOC135490891 n=1 Tax=Lineus longissimus TaxID=88925 RepID=UPI00315DBC14